MTAWHVINRREDMSSLDRRRFLQASAALGGALISSGIGRATRSAPVRIDPPAVDRVVVREITDNQHNVALRPLERPGLTVQRIGFPAAAEGKTLESEWASRCRLNRQMAMSRAAICSTSVSPRKSMRTISG